MKWLRNVLLLSPLFVSLFGLLFLSENVNAQAVTSNFYTQSHYTRNFESSPVTVTYGPISTPGYVLIETDVTGLWDYSFNMSFPNPFQNKTGTGFNAGIYFTLRSVNGKYVNKNLKNYMAKVRLGFEGLNDKSPYCSNSFKIYNQTDTDITFLLESSCPAGTFPSGTTFDQVVAAVDYSPESIIWCANDNPSQSCHSGTFGVLLKDVDYYFLATNTSQDSTNQTIINQNQTIINQNNQMLQQQEATNNWLTDDTAPTADTSSLGNAAGWLPPGPLDTILNLPIQFIQGIIGVFTNSNTCSPIVLPLGIVDYNLEIPCMRPFFELASVNIVWNTVGTIISAILIFNTLKWLYKFVDDTLSFRENNSTMWGGL